MTFLIGVHTTQVQREQDRRGYTVYRSAYLAIYKHVRTSSCAIPSLNLHPLSKKFGAAPVFYLMPSPLYPRTLDESDPFGSASAKVAGASSSLSASTIDSESTATTLSSSHETHTRSFTASSSSLFPVSTASTTIAPSSFSSAAALSSDSQTALPSSSPGVSTSSAIPSSPSSGTQPAALNLKAQRSHRVTIAVGVAAGLGAFAIVLFVAYMVLRRRKKIKRGAGRGSSFAEGETTKTYWNLDKQQEDRSPQDFFPKEYTGPWTDGMEKPRSSPLLI